MLDHKWCKLFPRCTASLAWGMVPKACALAQNVAEAWLSLSCLAFLQSQTLHGFFHLPPVLRAFCFQTIWAGLKLAFSSLSFTNTGSRCYSKVLKVETHLQEQIFVQAVLIQAILLQTKEHFRSFFFVVVVYFLPTMARGGQLKRRTTLSCLRFSIHAGLSTHS